MRASVPLIVEAATTCTGELTVDPFAGLHTFTPGEVGAVHVPLAPTVKVKDFF
jgi:hypothetical protein